MSQPVKHFWFSATVAERYRQMSHLKPLGPVPRNIARLTDGREAVYTECNTTDRPFIEVDDNQYLGTGEWLRSEGSW